jgi:hypothetical protein
MAFDSVNPQQMRAIAASMSKKSKGTMSQGYDPDLGSDVNDGMVGSGHGPSGSMGSGTPTKHPLPKPTQGHGGQRIK